MIQVAPASETSAADWFVAGLRGFGKSVLSVVPAGFPSYVRVFNPAYRGAEEVTWSEVAAVRRKHVHAGMQMDWTSGRLQLENEEPPEDFDRWPDHGTLPVDIARALVPVLARHTGTPERCCFATLKQLFIIVLDYSVVAIEILGLGLDFWNLVRILGEVGFLPL